MKLDPLPDQTHTRSTSLRPAKATVAYAGKETIGVPFGDVAAHHLRVAHPRDGGVMRSDYWFSAEPGMQNVLVKYQGPYGVRYDLKQLAWRAYRDRSQPRPEPAAEARK